MHRNLYLSAISHHHPANKHCVLSTLTHTDKAICKEENLQAELNFLQWTFKQNSYTDQQVHHTVCQPQKVKPPQEDPPLITFLDFVEFIYNLVSRMLSKYNI
jgi:hypothetical protein